MILLHGAIYRHQRTTLLKADLRSVAAFAGAATKEQWIGIGLLSILWNARQITDLGIITNLETLNLRFPLLRSAGERGK